MKFQEYKNYKKNVMFIDYTYVLCHFIQTRKLDFDKDDADVHRTYPVKVWYY